MKRFLVVLCACMVIASLSYKEYSAFTGWLTALLILLVN